MSDNKQIPAKLTQLAANVMVDTLSETTKEMKKALGRNSNPNQNQTPNESGPSSSSNKFMKSDTSVPKFNSLGTTHDEASTRTALKVMDVRKYVRGSVGNEVQPLVLKHVIARAIAERNIPLIRFVIPTNVEVLDFRALDYWITQ